MVYFLVGVLFGSFLFFGSGDCVVRLGLGFVSLCWVFLCLLCDVFGLFRWG